MAGAYCIPILVYERLLEVATRPGIRHLLRLEMEAYYGKKFLEQYLLALTEKDNYW